MRRPEGRKVNDKSRHRIFFEEGDANTERRENLISGQEKRKDSEGARRGNKRGFDRLPAHSKERGCITSASKNLMKGGNAISSHTKKGG